MGIVSEQPDTDVLEEAVTLTENALQAHPEIGGFFVSNASNPIGAARAVANAGLSGEVAIVGMGDGIDPRAVVGGLRAQAGAPRDPRGPPHRPQGRGPDPPGRVRGPQLRPAAGRDPGRLRPDRLGPHGDGQAHPRADQARRRHDRDRRAARGPPLDAIDAGLIYLPEERKAEGTFPLLFVAENAALPSLERLCGLLRMRNREMLAEVGSAAGRMRAKLNSLRGTTR